MTPPRLDSWKYQYAGPGAQKRWQKPLALGLLLASMLTYQHFPVPFFLLIAALLAALLTQKRLLLGARYLICGNRIVYFANIQRVDRDDPGGRLTLSSPSGEFFCLERSKFPTNARKPEKIRRNREAKFAKVAERIVLNVRAANPTAEIIIQC